MMPTCMRSLRNGIPALLCLLPLTSLGQARGTIVGTVTDSTGAVIVGARVTATQVSTQIAQKSVTSSSGVFAIPNLAVGTYSVRVEANGFQSASAVGITLDVSQQRDVDFQLSPGNTAQSVEVTAAAPLLNTTNATLAGLVTQQQVETLPLNGRSIQNLVMLQPGLAQDPGTMGWLAPQWVGDGNRPESELMTLDGADASDHEMGTVQFWNFNLDAIAEFKVLQSNYSAEYGEGGGTITQMVSKAGGNQFHGSAFEFIRNSVLDARNYFSTTVTPFQRNEFGATLGGPIIRRKTFFFGQYAGFRQLLGEPQIAPVPTADEQKGLVTMGGYQYQVPLNPVAAEILGKYPAPNQPTGLYGPNTLNVDFKQPLTVNQYSIRIDHHLSEGDYLFGRASVINNKQNGVAPIPEIENPNFGASNVNEPRNFAVSETHTFTPALINTAIFSVNRQIEGSIPDDLSQLQLYTDTTFNDGSLTGWGPASFTAKNVNTYYDLSDKVSWSKGRHLLNMGILYRYGQDNGWAGTQVNGTYAFSPGTTLPSTILSTNGGPPIPAGSASPNGLISMMEGVPVTYYRGTAAPGFGPSGGGIGRWGMRLWRLATYFQDDYKAMPKLTLNLGLRYEYGSAPYEIRSRFGGIVETGPLAGSFVLNPNPLYHAQKLNFAPRLGFAYEASNQTVVRGGFAIFTNFIPNVYLDQAALNFPMASLNIQTLPSTYSLAPAPLNLPPVESTSGVVMPPNGNTRLIPPFTPVNLAPIAAIVGPIVGWWPSQSIKNGYTLSANLTVEQKLPADMALQMSYITANGMEVFSPDYPNAFTGALPQNTPYTDTTPGLAEFQLAKNQAISHYNALQVQMRKVSPLHGLQYQANYTFASDLADADSIFSDYGPSGGITPNNPNCLSCEYARANYNVRHRFVGNFSYAIPGRWDFVPSKLSNGWSILGIYQAQTGLPFTVLEPYGTLQYGTDVLNSPYGGTRPFIGQATTKAPSGTPQFFSNAVLNNVGNYFVSPQAYSPIVDSNVQSAPGNLPRNTFTGPSWWNADFSVMKNTQLLERLNMEFRAEFFNIFNHPQFSSPYSVIGTGFGFSTATNSATSERQIQFGVRLIF